MAKHVIHAHSVKTDNGNPKLPDLDRIEYGEIAINYASGVETISFKNTDDKLVLVKTDDYYQKKFDDTNKKIEDNELVTSAALNNLNERLDNIPNEVLVGDIILVSFLEGVNTTTSVTSVPVTKRLCIATVTAGAQFTLTSLPSAGREIHVIVKNTNSSDITITLPNGSNSGVNYNNNGVETLIVKGSSFGEINAISDGTTVYIRTI